MAKKFSTPYGDGTYTPNGNKLPLLFSPPYGDGTGASCCDSWRSLFSPPYGDGTDEAFGYQEAWAFSPPYGDCNLNISQNTAKLKSRMARKYSLYYNDVLLR